MNEIDESKLVGLGYAAIKYGCLLYTSRCV